MRQKEEILLWHSGPPTYDEHLKRQFEFQLRQTGFSVKKERGNEQGTTSTTALSSSVHTTADYAA